MSSKDFKKWVLFRKTSWRQKSRKLWLKEGYKSTKSFHKNAHYRRNCLAQVRMDENQFSGEEERVSKAYRHLFAENCD